MTEFPAHGLYAITDPTISSSERLVEQVESAIRGGAVVIQYRDNLNPAIIRHELAGKLLTVCRDFHIPLIINDDVTLAREIGADGVHLGKSDAAVKFARETLSDNAIIGVSCYNDYKRAVRATEQGASYVAFGRFFPSKTKPHAIQANVALLRKVKSNLNIPVVAIGGITPRNGFSLIESGADLLAVVAGVFAEADPRQAAQHYAELFVPSYKRSNSAHA